MKKTLTVNLGGTVFHIDEDAYRLLVKTPIAFWITIYAI